MPLTGNSPNATPGARAFARQKRTILVAEDGPDSREMLQVLLEMKGYAVISAVDGPQAIDVAAKQLPDLILIDLGLPGLDGISVAKKLRRYPGLQAVPIIIISGHDPSKYRAEALNAGCDEYLLKPIDFARLDQILRQRIPVTVRAHTA